MTSVEEIQDEVRRIVEKVQQRAAPGARYVVQVLLPEGDSFPKEEPDIFTVLIGFRTGSTPATAYCSLLCIAESSTVQVSSWQLNKGRRFGWGPAEWGQYLEGLLIEMASATG